jgi:hypothetical protein
VKWAESGPGQPALRVRLAGGGRLAIEANGDPVLFAVAMGCRDDIHVLYADAGRRLEVLPAWTAAECRRLGSDLDRWLFEIRRRLQASPASPLHSGEWVLRCTAVPWVQGPSPLLDKPGWPRSIPGWPGLALAPADDEPDGSVTAQICGHSLGLEGSVISLRRLSAPGAARVKAWRRLAREGALAPVLLLAVSGLSGYVILDGHDRLAAATAEGIRPPLAFLGRADPESQHHAARQAVERYERAMAYLEENETERGFAAGALDAARSQAAIYLAGDLAVDELVPVLGWPLPAQEWERTAARVSPAWLRGLAGRPPSWLTG